MNTSLQYIFLYIQYISKMPHGNYKNSTESRLIVLEQRIARLENLMKNGKKNNLTKTDNAKRTQYIGSTPSNNRLRRTIQTFRNKPTPTKQQVNWNQLLYMGSLPSHMNYS